MAPRFAGRVRKVSWGPWNRCVLPRAESPLLGLALALALVLGLGAPPAAGAEETAEARYARELLLAEAERAVRLDAPLDLEGPRTALRRDQALLASPPPGADAAALAALRKTVAAREILLGRPAVAADGTVTWSAGALGEAAELLRWVLGEGECAIRVASAQATPGRASPTALDIAWPPPAEDPPATEAPPRDLEGWATWARQRAGGSLLGVRIEAVSCTPLTELQTATRRMPDYLPRDLPVPPRPTVDVEAAAFLVNEPLLRLRTLQSAERVDAFSKEAPAESFVDESAVREKALRADELEAQLATVKERRDAVAGDLREMATSTADLWRGLLGLLADQLEAAKSNAGEAAEADPRLRALVAQENAAVLEQRLFYLSALRTAETFRRLERWIVLLENEVLAAQGARTRFSDALVRARRERQLVRLQFERNVRLGPQLRAADEEIAALEVEAAAGAEAAAQVAPRLAIARAQKASFEALLAVNDVVLEAVRRRRALGERAKPPAAPAPIPAPTPPAAPGGPSPAEGSDGLAALRSPETAAFDVTYVKVARERLADPTQNALFDADLVARHHAAVDERLAALRSALRAVADVVPLQDRYATLATVAERRIAELAALGTFSAKFYAGQHRQKLEMHGADFADAFKGIEAERARLRERVTLLENYRAALMGADGRNFAIRVRRSIRPESIATSAAATAEAFGTARRWIALDGEQHLGTFVRDRWLALLGLIASAVAVILVVRKFRRALDLAIERGMAARVPVLAEGGGMQQEKVRAQEQKAEAEEATRTATEAVLGVEDGPRAPEGVPPPREDAPR